MKPIRPFAVTVTGFFRKREIFQGENYEILSDFLEEHAQANEAALGVVSTSDLASFAKTEKKEHPEFAKRLDCLVIVARSRNIDVVVFE